MTFHRRHITYFAALTVVVTVSARPQEPTFEVASIRPTTRPEPPFDDNNRGPRLRGRLYRGTTTARNLIRTAYGLKLFQRVDGSSNVLDEFFSVQAKVAGEAAVTRDVVNAMLRSLLAERFNLKVRFVEEMLESGVLHRVSADGLPPKLKSIDDPCPKFGAVPPPVQVPTPQILKPTCGTWMTNGVLSASIRDMSQFADFISMAGDLPVFDETGLKGAFEFETTYNPETIGSRFRLDPTHPALQFQSFAKALRDDLGLRMDRERRAVSMLVVEHIERPSEN